MQLDLIAGRQAGRRCSEIFKIWDFLLHLKRYIFLTVPMHFSQIFWVRCVFKCIKFWKPYIFIVIPTIRYNRTYVINYT